MEMMVTTEATRCAKLQSVRHHQQTDTQLVTGWMPFMLPNQQCQSIKGKIIYLTYYWLSLSFRFNGHFPGGPGLAGVRMSPFWILLELKVIEVVVTTGAITCAKLQSKCHHQQINTHFYRPFLSPNQQCQSTEGKVTYHWLIMLKACYCYYYYFQFLFRDHLTLGCIPHTSSKERSVTAGALTGILQVLWENIFEC